MVAIEERFHRGIIKSRAGGGTVVKSRAYNNVGETIHVDTLRRLAIIPTQWKAW
jgi:hypothetical protein